MCIVVRFVDPEGQMRPWVRAKLVINVPWSVTRSAALFIVRETLRALGVPQEHEDDARCFCGEAITVPALGELAEPYVLHTARREAMRHGA